MSSPQQSPNPFLFESGLKSSCTNPCVGLRQLNLFCDNDPCNYGKSRSYATQFRCECEINGGAVAGLVVGVLAGIMLISIICFCCVWRRHRANNLTTTQVYHASTLVYTNGAPPPPQSPNANQPLLPTYAQPQQVYPQSPYHQQPQYPAYHNPHYPPNPQSNPHAHPRVNPSSTYAYQHQPHHQATAYYGAPMSSPLAGVVGGGGGVAAGIPMEVTPRGYAANTSSPTVGVVATAESRHQQYNSSTDSVHPGVVRAGADGASTAENYYTYSPPANADAATLTSSTGQHEGVGGGQPRHKEV